MELLEGVELGQQGVEAAKELQRRGRVEVVDCGDGEAEEKVVCGFARELARVEAGHSGEIWLVEEICVEPVDAALVTFMILVCHSFVPKVQGKKGGGAHAFRR